MNEKRGRKEKKRKEKKRKEKKRKEKKKKRNLFEITRALAEFSANRLSNPATYFQKFEREKKREGKREKSKITSV